MSSTLRSLVLRYKANLKDFQKGNRRVIDDIKSTRREVTTMSKDMRKAFDPKIDRMKAQIQSLNATFRAGRMDVHKYGTAVDALKQKIASITRMKEIRTHEIGALRARNFAAASANKTLSGAFTGTAQGVSISQMLSSTPESPTSVSRGGATFFGAPSRDVKKLWKRMMPFAGAMAAAKIYGDARQATDDMAKQPFGTFGRAAGGVVKPGFDFLGGIHKLPGKALATGIGAVADMLSGGAVSHLQGTQGETAKIMSANNAIAERNRMRDAAMAPQNEFDDALESQREIDDLVKRKTINEMKAAQQVALQAKEYDRVHTLSLAIVEARKKNMEWAEREKQIEEAKFSAVRGMLDAMRDERAFGELIDTGMSPEAARVKLAGGTDRDIADAEFMSQQLKDRQRWRDSGNVMADLIQASEDAAAARTEARKAKMLRDQQTVGQFAQQFDTPQEAFQRSLREIQNMMTLGLDPKIAQRAMMANARGLVGATSRFDRFAPAAEVGSREEMAMRDQAKFAGKQEKKINELVEIQKQALKVAKEKGDPVKIELTEVSI